jgi:2-methylaconitate isomerase
VTLRRIPAAYYRGGTSRGLIFRAADLPADRAAWDAIFLAAMGVPDPHGRNLDGMGGGLSSLNKVCVVGPASRADADVDYTFAQLSVNDARVDYSGNCGNMSAAIGPFALEEGLVLPPHDGEAAIRIHNTNTGKIIVARFPVAGGALAADGDLAIDGVVGTAAPIRLEFLSPGGAKTGKLLPTGNAVDVLNILQPRSSQAKLRDATAGSGVWASLETNGTVGQALEVSCIDAANPCVFVRASDVGKSGSESPQELEADTGWLASMEAIRRAGANAMGLPDVPSIPKVAMLAPGGDGADIAVRMISVGQPHRAVPITGAVCLAVAARVPGTIAHGLCAANEARPIRIAHPSGITQVDARVAGGVAEYGAVYRTARRLFEGAVVLPGN